MSDVVRVVTGALVVVLVLVGATAFALWRGGREGKFAGSTAAAQDDGQFLTSHELGRQLGRRATLVQVSSAFCQPCRAARAILSHVAGSADGVAHIEIDAEHNLDLVCRLGVMRTPTTFMLDGTGRVLGRATGVPRLEDVRASLP